MDSLLLFPDKEIEIQCISLEVRIMHVNTARITTQIKYSILLIIILISISLYWFPMQDTNTFGQLTMNIIQLIQLSFLFYLTWSTRSQVREELYLFFKIVVIILGVAFLNTLFTTIHPLEAFGPQELLTKDNSLVYLPYSVFNYIESFCILISLFSLFSVRTTKSVKIDLILSMLTITLTIFLTITATIQLILEEIFLANLVGESEIMPNILTNISYVHLEILFPAIAIASLIAFLIYRSLHAERILLNRKSSALYIIYLIFYVLWGVFLIVDLVIPKIWIPIPLLGYIHTLSISFLVYGIFIHFTTPSKKIAYITVPKSSYH